MIRVFVNGFFDENERVRVYELHSLDGGELQPFSAGAHIDLHLGNGLHRSYSLVNDPAEHHRYVIAVARDAQTRGGSAFIHDTVRKGDVLEISAPKNNFALNESANHSVLIAGGIGITPMLSMMRRLDAIRASWELHFCSQSRSQAAFHDQLSTDTRVRFFFDDEHQGSFIDIANLVATALPGSHFYCCGPAGMLDAFAKATTLVPAEHVHVEHFSAEPPAQTGDFLVECARSGKTIPVSAGQTILNALREAGINVAYSCEQGICGTCETAVLGGIPEHKDQVLSQAERDSGKTIMICCSGALTHRLVLDI